MKNIVLFLFCTVSTGLITNALRTEKIFNGQKAGSIQRQYVTGILAAQGCRGTPKIIGSGAMVSAHFVLSAAHHFVDLTSRGDYKLKRKTFYVHLGAIHLDTDLDGEVVLVETLHLLGYNITTGDKDLIAIKIAHPRTVGMLSWGAVFIGTLAMQEEVIWEAKVASHGMHNTLDAMDRVLRYAIANIVDNDQCDNILPNSSQICIKMYKDTQNRPRGLCKNDGGAPYVERHNSGYYLVAIAGKPKENCDDTETGAVYTDVRPFEENIYSLIRGSSVASQILNNNPRSAFTCLMS